MEQQPARFVGVAACLVTCPARTSALEAPFRIRTQKTASRNGNRAEPQEMSGG
jgi:hypothetical protein